MKNCYANYQLCFICAIFLNQYGNQWNTDIITDELKEIDQFIESANTIDSRKAFSDKYFFGDEISKIVFRRLLLRYYDKKKNIQHDAIDAAQVYAKYFLFRDLLKSKFQSKEVTELQQREPKPPGTIGNNSINELPEIFAETGYQTFKMLDEKYKKDNKNLRAKYSNLYRFLDYKELLKCTQIEYIGFIHENYSVKLSKILPKTVKYEDIIQPLLMRYLTGQQ